jgi:hypothetical protein
MCRINFGSDGSLFFSFPYFPHSQGILAKGRYRAGDTSAKIPLTEHGKVTSHLAKLTHHTSGEVLFESPRDCRRLHSVRGLEYVTTQPFLPRSPEPSRALGPGSHA